MSPAGIFVILLVAALIIAVIVFVVKKANQASSVIKGKNEEKANPVNIYNIQMFQRIIAMARAGQLTNYTMNPYMFYYNFGATYYTRSEYKGSRIYFYGDTKGILIDYMKSGMQPMSDAVYRQCSKQLYEVLQQLPNVESIVAVPSFKILNPDARFIDAQGHYNSENISGTGYKITYKPVINQSGKSWT